MTENIGNKLKKIRIDNNLSVDKFADIMGVKSRTIGAYERNENNPPLEFLQLFSKKFKVDLNWLILTGEETEPAVKPKIIEIDPREIDKIIIKYKD